jgi:hypothetical protein
MGSTGAGAGQRLSLPTESVELRSTGQPRACPELVEGAAVPHEHLPYGKTRWDEKAGLDGMLYAPKLSIDGLEAQEIKETGNEED